MTTTAALDAQKHSNITGHPTEVWDDGGRLRERIAGEPGLPLWDDVDDPR